MHVKFLELVITVENNYNDFKFKKKFGQNFLTDKNIINLIVKKSEISDNSLVIEIGPGAGALTQELAKCARNVLCYEIDTSLKEILDKLEEKNDNVKVIYQDFLKADPLSEIKKYTYDELYIISNLPYYITTPIIEKIINDKLPVNKIVVMVQKEVGERFTAKVGTKEYNSLTIYLNYYFQINKIIDVSRNVFIPKPNVDSVVVKFVKREYMNKPVNEELFFRLVKDSFRYKRKNLRNNLKEYNLEKIEMVLSKYNLDLNVRAEKMSIDLFIEIANSLSEF